MSKIPINEIFYSIQGEGLNIGTPAVFVRFTFCNLKCSFCDTNNTIKHSMETEEVVERILSFNCSHIVFTGGEPMLYQNEMMDIIALICEKTVTGPFYYEIETNGSLAPNIRLLEKINLVTVSPKITEDAYRYNPSYSFISKRPNPKVVFKFVVKEESDLTKISDFCFENVHNNEIIYLMPCATSATEQFTRLPFIIDYAKHHSNLNFRVSFRLHSFLWGRQRGV